MCIPVNSILRADFAESGTDIGILIDIVGEPTVQHYNHGQSSLEEEEAAFINVPHIHPGRDMYSSQNIELRSVYDFSWKASMLLGHVALDVVDGHLHENVKLPPRLQLCTEIVEKYSALKASKKHTPFFKAFDEAKKGLKQTLAATQRQYKYRTSLAWSDLAVAQSSGVRWLLDDTTARSKLVSMGLAEGDAYSEDRRTQLNRLWNLKVPIPELYWTLPHGDTDPERETWVDLLMAPEKGQSLFRHLISDFSPSRFAKTMVKVFKLDYNLKSEWFTGSEGYTSAELHCGFWFNRNRLTDTNEKLAIRDRFPDEYAAAFDLQGRNIGVSPSSGLICIRWLQVSGDQVDVRLVVKLAIPPPSRQHEPQALSFTPDGIDVVDSAGKPFRFQIRKDTMAAASVTKEALPGTQTGELAYSIWKAVLEAHGVVVPEPSSENAREWGAKGVDMLSRTAVGESVKQNRPLKPEDALYPLDVFSQHRFPEGGRFRTAPKARLADSTEELQDFVAHLRTLEFIGHPYSASWRGKLEGSKPDVALFNSNLPILRACVKDSVNRYSPQLAHLAPKDRGVHETHYDLGPPGTGTIDDPYVKPPKRAYKKKTDDSGASTEKKVTTQADRKLTGKNWKSRGREDAVEADAGDNEGEESDVSEPSLVKKSRKLPKAAPAKLTGGGGVKKASKVSKAGADDEAGDSDGDDDVQQSKPAMKAAPAKKGMGSKRRNTERYDSEEDNAPSKKRSRIGRSA
ncbi:hypothetical protein LTR08_004911 [Meristemomyces frigidus]|nr:hypothetical protein LTR08_004911 [Meristemomyces frigidus]